ARGARVAAPGLAGQPPDRRPGRARGARPRDRALPERDPADAGHRRDGRRPARGRRGMKVALNGTERQLPEGATVLDAVAAAAGDPHRGGIAVAVDGDVVPRGRWAEVALA